MLDANSDLDLVQRFFSGTGASYDFMVNFATLGIDRRWKRRIVELIPPEAMRILDLACGTGISTLAIAERFPSAQIVGVELRSEYLDIARRKIVDLGVGNVDFVLCRAEDYRCDAPFDCVTSSYLAKYADLDRLAANLRNLVAPGGRVLMHDFTFPPGWYRVALFRAYFKVMQLAMPVAFPAWREIYHGLPHLIERTRWLEELPRALARTGFRDLRTEHLTLYGSAIVTARR